MIKKLLLGLYFITSFSFAQTFLENGIQYNITGSNTVEVIAQTTKYTGAVVIPSAVTYNSVPYNVTAIGKSAFSYCTELISVSIPSSVTSIGLYAFRNCSSLTSVTIPSSVTSMGNLSFYNCSGLTSITIPSSVTTMGEGVFANCSGLTSVSIPSSVTSIGNTVFANCKRLTSVNIPSSVTTIGRFAFNGCIGLTSVSIPSSVTSIGSDAFSSCIGLTSVSIPDSVTTIGSSAFQYCYRLTSVSIPSSVTTIGFEVFYNCTSLKDVYVNWNTPLVIDPLVFSNILLAGVNLHVPTGTESLYDNAAVWKDFGAILDAQIINHNHVASITYQVKNNQILVLLKKVTPAEVLVINSVGAVVKKVSVTTGSTTIDTTDLSMGLYFVKVYSEQGQTSQKIIKL